MRCPRCAAMRIQSILHRCLESLCTINPMRNPFVSKPSGNSSGDISRSSGRITNVWDLPKMAKKAYTAAVKRGKRENRLVSKQLSSPLATVSKPLQDDHRNPHPSDSTHIQQDVAKIDAQKSTVDASHLQSFEHSADVMSAIKYDPKKLDRHEVLPTHEDKITATAPKHQMQRSQYGTRHQLTILQRSPDADETERGWKEPDNVESRSHDNHSFEKKKETMKSIDHTAAELKATQLRNQALEERNRKLTNQLAALSIQLQGAETQHQQTLRLLEAKTSALKGAQAFLTTEDSLSGADVIGMVDTLNAEILQIAAFMADRLADIDRDLDAATETEKEAHEIAVQSSGEHMVRILESRAVQPKPDDDSMELQIALQFCLVYSCNSIIDSWMPGYWQRGSLLTDIHSRIMEKEGQAVSGRWRAITRSHVKHLVNSYPHVMDLVTTKIGSILSVAGWSQRLLQEKGLLKIFQEKLAIIGTLALRLQATIGESIISGDMQTFLIPPDANFDPDMMEDGFSQGGQSVKTGTGERVAGTTDIGLQKSVKGSGIQILRKPKTVLCSALD